MPIADERRHISGSTTGVLLRYLERMGGKDLIDRVIAAAGVAESAEALSDISSWWPYDTVVALLDAAEAVTGDPSVARRAGEELLSQYAGTEVAALLRALGSPTEVLRNVALSAGKYSTVTTMAPEELGEAYAIVSAKARGVRRHPQFCRYTEGVLSQASALFGLAPATVREVQCETKGADRCLYRVEWNPNAAAGDDLEGRLAFLELQLGSLTSRFEALQSTAAELASARNVESALSAITRRAAIAVRAPRFLLAVRIGAGAAVRSHYLGMSAEDAEDLVGEILADDPDDHGGSRLIVDVVASGRVYGRLAAIYPDGVQFFPHEQAILASYADHAAAALDKALALEAATKENSTARALLSLAHGLADVVSQEEVAERVALAVHSLVDCDQASVLVWDEEARLLRLRATWNVPPDSAGSRADFAIGPADTPLVEEMLTSPRPHFVESGSGDEYLDRLLSLVGARAIAAVPIARGHRLFGVVTAALDAGRADVGWDADLVERLTGLAAHAATAMHNAQLLEQVRHQALHDPLTSLPNSRLLEDRVGVALEHARRDGGHVALLFVDLDGFKAVNDRFGHRCGDEVLKQAAARLQASIRASDTVARLGGDEFVVVLPRLSDRAAAEAVGAKLAAALVDSFSVDGVAVTLGASVGVALFPDEGHEFDQLLHAADVAMYEVKTSRRTGSIAST